MKYYSIHEFSKILNVSASKTCSECGSYKKDLKLSDREYVCEECGCVIDRDLNASINLAKYQQLVA